MIVLSLAANALLATLLFKPTHSSAPSEVAAPPKPAPATQKAATAAVTTSGTAETPTQPLLPSGFHWGHLESSDYKEYIARLRAFGVPERTIRDIIMAEVSKMYRPKFAALRPPRKADNPNFWEDRYGYSPTRQTKEQLEQTRALSKEQKELVKALLGSDVYDQIASDSGQPDWTSRMFGSSVSDEVREKFSDLQQKYYEARQDLQSPMSGYYDPETQTDLKKLERKFYEDMAAFLTPEQIQMYQMRQSDIASRMRYEMGAFAPSEEEYRAIFAYKQGMEDVNALNRYDPESRPSPEQMKAASEQRKALEETLAKALTPERMKEMKLLEDYGYRNLVEAGFGMDTIVQMDAMKKQAELASAKLRGDRSLSSEDRNAAMQEIRTSAEKALTEMLGERRAKAYSRNGGYWMRNLAPRSTP